MTSSCVWCRTWLGPLLARPWSKLAVDMGFERGLVAQAEWSVQPQCGIHQPVCMDGFLNHVKARFLLLVNGLYLVRAITGQSASRLALKLSIGDQTTTTSDLTLFPSIQMSRDTPSPSSSWYMVTGHGQ